MHNTLQEGVLSAYLCVAEQEFVDTIRAGGTFPHSWRVESEPIRALAAARSEPSWDLIVIDENSVQNGAAIALMNDLRSLGPVPILYLRSARSRETGEGDITTPPDVHVYDRASPPAVLRHAMRRLVRRSRDRRMQTDATPERIEPPAAGEQTRIVSEVFGDLGLDPKVNIRTIVRRTAEVIGGVASLYNRLDDEAKSLVTWAHHHLPADAPPRDDPTGHICYEATIKGADKPVVIGEIDHTEFAATDTNVVRYNLHSYIGFPVLADGVPIGSLCVVDTLPREFSDSDVDAIEALAHAVEHEERHLRVREMYRRDVDQREMSIREVQHRIKNDLAIVKATLDIRAAADQDSNRRTPLLQAAAQIDVMRRVYDRLSVDNASGDVELSRFVRELMGDLRSAIIPRETTIHVNLEQCTVSARMAITVGTIVNELVTNSVKYAFTDTTDPQISVTLACRTDRSIRVTVSDNGVGLPESVLSGETRGFGLTATHALASQQRGTVDLRTEGGARTTVTLFCNA